MSTARTTAIGKCSLWLGAAALAGAGLLLRCGGGEFATASPSQGGAAVGAAGAGGSAGLGGSGGVGGGAGTSGGAGAGGIGHGGSGGSGGSGGGTGGAAGSGGVLDAGGACSAAEICVPAPPTGWTAPGWVSHDPTSACPGPAWPTMLYDPALLAQPPAAKCTCGCGPGMVTCVGNVSCVPQNDTTCSGGSVYSADATCMSAPAPFNGPAKCSSPGVSAKTSCGVAGMKDVPAVGWTANAMTCAGGSTVQCGGTGVCTHAPPSGATGPCIVGSGDVACPASPYTSRTVLYQTFSDDRACSFTGCSCASSTDPICSCASGACGVRISMGGCTATSMVTVPTDGSCVAFNPDAAATTWAFQLAGYVGSAFSCTPAGVGTASGQVTPTGPITVCCKP